MAANRKKGMFNWQGIDENSDGTYTAQGRIEKRRLLKELHRQGVAIRSKHNDDGTWTVSPIGMRAPRRAVGHRPRTRYPVSRPRQDLRQPLRSLYSQGQPRPSFHPSYHHPMYAAPPRPRVSGGISKKAGDWMRERMQKRDQEQREKILRKKNEQEINQKMQNDRIQSERKETVMKVRANETRGRLLQERAQQERHEHAERMRADIEGKSTDHNELAAARIAAIENKE